MRSDFERAVLVWKAQRRQWQMRVAAALGSALLILLACWSAGVFDQWRGWFAPQAEVPVRTQAPAPVIPTPPIAANSGSRRADERAVGKMRLVATQPGRNAREGAAQLATGDADPLTYVAGALLANGASLVEVHTDHVLLRRGNATTELYVDGMARAARAGKASKPDEALITVTEAVTQPSKAVGPETYASMLRTAPRFIDNAIAGFEVYPGTDAGALSRLSLQRGDVLLELDGRVLKSVEQLHESLKAISAGASVTATVERGPEQLVVTLDGTALRQRQSPSLADLPR
jgi:hypothetical protein